MPTSTFSLRSSLFLAACSIGSVACDVASDDGVNLLVVEQEGTQMAIADWSLASEMSLEDALPADLGEPQQISANPMAIDIEALVLGMQNIIYVDNVPPGAAVYLVGGFDNPNGAVHCPAALGGSCLEIQGRVFPLGRSQAGDGSQAKFSLRAPRTAPPAGVQLQAVIYHDGAYTLTKVQSPIVSSPLGDEDGDGVQNGRELMAGTSLLNADTDGDGASDFAELKAGSDPLDASSLPAPQGNLPS